jgi:hypothetical protein
MSERLPEPTKEQVALALEVARRALDGEEVRLYAVRDDGSGNGRRLRARPIDLGEIEEA